MGFISSLKQAFSKPYTTVSVAEAKELLSSGATLVDVRSAQEWRSGRAPQAKHVPLDRLQASTAGIQKTRPVVAICASGVRSAAEWPPGARPASRSAEQHHHFKGETNG
jgi:3-mercaptopyruvate sulfurtransferase SseA